MKRVYINIFFSIYGLGFRFRLKNKYVKKKTHPHFQLNLTDASDQRSLRLRLRRALPSSEHAAAAPRLQPDPPGRGPPPRRLHFPPHPPLRPSPPGRHFLLLLDCRLFYHLRSSSRWMERGPPHLCLLRGRDRRFTRPASRTRRHRPRCHLSQGSVGHSGSLLLPI